MNGLVQAIDQAIIRLNEQTTMTFVPIPACPEGFLMGSRGYRATEEPIHRVVIEEDFWMAQTPLTQAQFAAWTSSEGIEHKNRFQGKPDHPAESMTWHQASEYCDWLTKKFDDQFPSEPRFATLPTEAHWEYACRAGTDTEYYSGDGEAALHQSGWFDDTSSSTHPVGKLRPNDFGLHDMHGNVWEWCLDRWDKEVYRRRWDGITVEETFRLNEEFGDQGGDPYRLLRGGSWLVTAVGCRTAYRIWGRAGFSLRFVGFRVCLVRSPIISSQSDRPASREQ